MHCEIDPNPNSVGLTVKVNGEVKVKCKVWRKRKWSCQDREKKKRVKRVGEMLDLFRKVLDIVQL